MKKKVKNGNRYCPICGHHLQQKGKYKNKTSHRWYCPKCHKYTIINKKQKKKKKYILWLFKYFEYLTHSKKMSEYEQCCKKVWYLLLVPSLPQSAHK